MKKNPENRLKIDIGVGIATSTLATLILCIFNNPILSFNFSAFGKTITTVLGILFTVLAILYTFESQFENNRAVKMMKDNGTYENVLNIFFYSVSAIGIVWLYTFPMMIFNIQPAIGWRITAFITGLEIGGFVIVVLRLIRCYSIFLRFNRAMRESR